MDIAERIYETRIDRKIETKELEYVDQLVGKKLSEMNKQNGISLWDLNVLYYSAAVTLLERQGKLKEKTITWKPQKKPGWQIMLEERIYAIRRKLSYIDVILKCKKENRFTTRQRNLEKKLRNWYGKTTVENLFSTKCTLKQNLKAESEELRRRKNIKEQIQINRIFGTSPKNVYWKFKVEADVEVKEGPSKENIDIFWRNISKNRTEYKSDADWLQILEKHYCKDVTQKRYDITEVFKGIVSRMQNNKAPGPGLITMYWLKKLESTHHWLIQLLKQVKQGEIRIPMWLIVIRTTLLAKNNDTKNPKNYRPIACQNSLYKVYTSIINSFFKITVEQITSSVRNKQQENKEVGGVLISF